MRILLWHVHGSWTTAFVQGTHEYLIPVLPGRVPDGRGRAQTWDWPESAIELTPDQIASTDIDVVIAQRPAELLHLVEAWTGRRPGIDLPCIYLEHNTPDGRVEAMRHPAAGCAGIHVVHVTHFNQLFWDTGTSTTSVIEHGIVDPGALYQGDISRAAVVINDPLSRPRVTGLDLLPHLQDAAPIDLFGMHTEHLGGQALPQAELHPAMAQRRVYLHPYRWTSLGLSLIEAMHMGMPVVALATTEACEAIPPGAGVVSNRIDVLADGLRRLTSDADEAAACGRAARQAALARFGLKRFLDDWDRTLEEVVRR